MIIIIIKADTLSRAVQPTRDPPKESRDELYSRVQITANLRHSVEQSATRHFNTLEVC